jgi:hypothetical protein
MTQEEYEAEVSRLRHEAETRKQGERFMPQQFQVNKTWRIVLTLLTVALAALIALPIEQLNDLMTPRNAAYFILAVNFIKGIIDGIAPSAGTTTTPVQGATTFSLVTHKATS